MSVPAAAVPAPKGGVCSEDPALLPFLGMCAILDEGQIISLKTISMYGVNGEAASHVLTLGKTGPLNAATGSDLWSNLSLVLQNSNVTFS